MRAPWYLHFYMACTTLYAISSKLYTDTSTSSISTI